MIGGGVDRLLPRMIAASNFWTSSPLARWKRLSSSNYVRNVTATYATQVTVLGLQMVITTVVARSLGPPGRGLYAVASAIGVLGVRFTTFGLHASNTFYVAKRRDLLPSMAGNTLAYSLLAGTLAALALWTMFRIFPGVAPLQGPMLVLGLTWIPFGLAYLLLQNLLIGTGQIRTYNSIELVGKIAMLGAIVAIVLYHIVSPEVVFVVGLFVLIGTLVSALLRVRLLCAGGLTCSLSLVRETMMVGFRAYLISFFGF